MANEIIARLRLNGQQFVSDSKASFSAFNRDAIASAEQAKRSFQSTFGEIQNLAKTALQMPRNAAGALDLNAGGIRAAAAAAQQEAAALREIAVAAQRAAQESGDLSQSTRLYVQAANAAAIEADENVRSLNQQATALERLQIQLNGTRSAVIANDNAGGEFTRGMNRQAFAAQSLGQQVTDFSVQVLSGQNAMTAFAQQAPQAGLALAGFEGKLGAVGKFLTGPWGIALTVAVSALGILGMKLLEAGDNADKASKSFDSFGEAQSLLGKIVDLTTGKLKDQNVVLRESIELEARRNVVAAQKAERENVKALKGFGRATFTESLTAGALGIGYEGVGPNLAAAEMERQRAARQPLNAAIQKFIGGGFATADDQTGTKGAIGEIDRLAAASRIAGRDLLDLKESIINVGKNRNDVVANQGILNFLDGKGLDPRLKPYKRDPKPKSTTSRDEFGRDAADRIANLAATFGAEPDQTEKVRKALLQLDDLVDDIRRKKPLNMEQLLADAAAARGAIEDGINKPFREYLRTEREAVAIQSLAAKGRYVEADALRDALQLQREKGRLTAEELATVMQNAVTRERIARAMEDERRQIGLYISAVSDAQRTFEQFLSQLQGGRIGNSFKDLGKNLLAGFSSLNSRLLSEKIFGGLDRELEDLITGRTGIEAGGRYLADQAMNLGDTLKDLAGTVSAANDNWGAKMPYDIGSLTADDVVTAAGVVTTPEPEIVVEGSKQTAANTAALKSASEIYSLMGGRLTQRLGDLLGLPKLLTSELGQNLGPILQGASIGAAFGPMATDALGTKGSGLGGALGGAVGKKLGDKAGDAIGKAVGGKLGETLGSFAGPLGGIVGGAVGSAVLGAFKKTKWGSSTISFADGQLSAGAAQGNSAKAEKAASASADSVVGGVNRILEQLGGSLISAPNITVGQRHGDYRVNLGGTSLKKAKGAKDFDDDQQAAIEYAIQQLLAGAVIDGISEASKRILKSGQDLEDAITKAGLIEAIPRDLKAMLDPVGAAVDALNEKWKKTVDALREGGASTEQMEQAQKLYGLQLEKVKASTESASATLKEFTKSLMTGSASPLSLRDQEKAAKSALQPFLDTIAQGGMIDQGAYQSAAQTFLDIERQLYGSTGKFFEAFEQIQAATTKAIDRVDNAAPVSEAVANPFAEKTASATQASADLLSQISGQTQAQQQTLDQILAALRGGGGFIGLDRSFAA